MLLNWLGLRAGSRVQEVTSLTKALALIALVVVCFLVSPRAVSSTTVASQSLTQLPPLGLLIAIILALQPIIVSYDGWYGAIYFTEEDEDPARNLPRSSIIGVLACGAIFLLVNAALLHVLPIDKLGASQMPAADAAALIFGGYGRTVILVLSLVTAISTINDPADSLRNGARRAAAGLDNVDQLRRYPHRGVASLHSSIHRLGFERQL
jgi:APA family basic amino acid/polyamine antiporter